MQRRFGIVIVLLLTAALSGGCRFGRPAAPQQLLAQSDQSEWLRRAVHDHGRYYK